MKPAPTYHNVRRRFSCSSGLHSAIQPHHSRWTPGAAPARCRHATRLIAAAQFPVAEAEAEVPGWAPVGLDAVEVR